ncbi:hypothetical protein PMIN03_001553 [Paraphaeosphaeria minitans]
MLILPHHSPCFPHHDAFTLLFPSRCIHPAFPSRRSPQPTLTHDQAHQQWLQAFVNKFINTLASPSRKAAKGQPPPRNPLWDRHVKHPKLVRAQVAACAVRKNKVEHRAPNGIRIYGLVSYPSMPVCEIPEAVMCRYKK